MFDEIKGDAQKGKLIVMRRVMMGVAAAILLLAIGAWLLRPAAKPEIAKTQRPFESTASVITQADPIQRQKVIHTDNEQTLHLADGSTVVLYANSTLKYPEPFEGQRRAITLEGKALFTVAKDEARPFIVTAGSIETTVLGTEFSVTASPEEVRVRLYTGKVKLHATDQKWHKDIVLAPGEELNYTNKEAFVSNWNHEEQEEEVEPTALDQQLVFDNEPLPRVLDKLSEGYHRNITYNKQQIGNVYFTGTVQTSDSLTTILHVIATMNDLTIIPRKRGYSIRK
jgi:ferric-dicitrate binding protein FerR (iron transport regulator)